MYPYSNNPNQDPYNQGNVPPYNYNGNPNPQPPYGPYNYQNGPQGQPPYYNYPPRPPRQYGYVHPALRALGVVMIVLFFLAIFGHHGFFFFPVVPLIIFAVIMAGTRGSRYRQGWNRPYNHYNQHHGYNNWNNNAYQGQGHPYYNDYNQAPPPPGYYGPQQPPQSQTQVNNQGWPEPNDPYKNDMQNPY